MGDSCLEIVKLLANHPSIDLNAVGDRRKSECRCQTALHEAAACNSFEIVKFLVEKGANKAAKDSRRRMPIHCAIENGREDVALFLTEKMFGEDLAEEDENGTVLEKFAGNFGMAELAAKIKEKTVGLKANKENVVPEKEAAVARKHAIVERAADELPESAILSKLSGSSANERLSSSLPVFPARKRPIFFRLRFPTRKPAKHGPATVLESASVELCKFASQLPAVQLPVRLPTANHVSADAS
uniref:Ankyrin repeat protein n=1 Tax=Panagrolaimus sp. JU765 TaxID=591449 RepID=A0AC34QWQ7_9BILA